jgi:hypothetical protein
MRISPIDGLQGPSQGQFSCYNLQGFAKEITQLRSNSLMKHLLLNDQSKPGANLHSAVRMELKVASAVARPALPTLL